jgi:hypothetical protein
MIFRNKKNNEAKLRRFCLSLAERDFWHAPGIYHRYGSHGVVMLADYFFKYLVDGKCPTPKWPADERPDPPQAGKEQ